ncbi:hypothetical protein NL676_037464 [Syzygium grande]|nr:hypothetical protein NL676_037464 [Syzygium grande]
MEGTSGGRPQEHRSRIDMSGGTRRPYRRGVLSESAPVPARSDVTGFFLFDTGSGLLAAFRVNAEVALAGTDWIDLFSC